MTGTPKKYWMVHNSSHGGATNKKHETFQSACNEAQRLAFDQPSCFFTVLESITHFRGETKVYRKDFPSSNIVLGEDNDEI